MEKLKLTLCSLALACFVSACGGGGGGTPSPNAGFRMQTFAYNPFDPSVRIPTAGNVQGQFLQANGTTTGTVESFGYNHGGVGLLIATGARVPARWRLTLGPDFFGGGHCLTFETVDRNVSLNSTETLLCRGRFVGFTATPNAIDAMNPPATVAFSGKGLNSVYGEPALAIYDEFGYVVTSTQAQSNNLYWSGPELIGVEVSLPDISQVFDGIYTVVVNNIREDGSWEVVGAAPITIYGNPIPPPPPPPPDDPGCGSQSPDFPQLECENIILNIFSYPELGLPHGPSFDRLGRKL